MAHIVLVEDDNRLRQLISSFLQEQSFSVSALADGRDLLSTVAQGADLVILDVMLPGEDGFRLCQRLRQQFTGPVIFMTARGDDFDQVLGLEIGADDYVVKPIEPRVLLARIHALLRRTQSRQQQSPPSQQLRFGQLLIDKAARRVALAGSEVVLTSHEFDLLCLLAENASHLVDRERIYTDLIGREYDGLDRSADVRISRLRKKLNDNAQQPFRIKTIWGKGFFFVADAWD